jgi:four helix bundle protein
MTFPFLNLDVYRSARELAVLVAKTPVKRASLRDQLDRAAESVVLALAEGLPHDSLPMRRQYFKRAKASLCEVAGAIDLAAAIDAVDAQASSEILALAGRVRAMTIALMR